MAHEYLLAAEAGLKAMYTNSFPFIVIHGADDTLTDPDGSKLLYERSQVTPASFVRAALRTLPSSFHVPPAACHALPATC